MSFTNLNLPSSDIFLFSIIGYKFSKYIRNNRHFIANFNFVQRTALRFFLFVAVSLRHCVAALSEHHHNKQIAVTQARSDTATFVFLIL